MSAKCEACKHPTANHVGIGGCQMPWCSCRLEFSTPPAPRALWACVHCNRACLPSEEICPWCGKASGVLDSAPREPGVDHDAARKAAESIIDSGVTGMGIQTLARAYLALRVPAAPVHHAHCPLAGQPIRFESCCQPAAPVSGEPCRDCCVVGGHLFNCARYAEGFENAFIAWERTLPPNELYIAGPNATDTPAAPSGGSEVSEAWSAWASTVEHIVEGLSSDHLRAPLSNQALEHIDNFVARLTNLAAALRAGGPTP